MIGHHVATFEAMIAEADAAEQILVYEHYWAHPKSQAAEGSDIDTLVALAELKRETALEQAGDLPSSPFERQTNRDAWRWFWFRHADLLDKELTMTTEEFEAMARPQWAELDIAADALNDDDPAQTYLYAALEDMRKTGLEKDEPIDDPQALETIVSLTSLYNAAESAASNDFEAGQKRAFDKHGQLLDRSFESPIFDGSLANMKCLVRSKGYGLGLMAVYHITRMSPLILPGGTTSGQMFKEHFMLTTGNGSNRLTNYRHDDQEVVEVYDITTTMQLTRDIRRALTVNDLLPR